MPCAGSFTKRNRGVEPHLSNPANESRVILLPRMQRSLETTCARLADLPFPWAVTGSVGLVVSGFDLEPRDLDLETDAPGAVAIGGRLATEAIEPVRLVAGERVRSHYGRFDVEGVVVEVMGDMSIRDAAGTWHPRLDFEADVEILAWCGLTIPVVRPAAQLRMYERLGRPERVALLRRHLATSD
jgi:hypothetical protein